MVKISTLASAVDTPEEEALSPRSLSFRDKQFDPFTSFTSKSISPQGAERMMEILQCSAKKYIYLQTKKCERSLVWGVMNFLRDETTLGYSSSACGVVGGRREP